MPSLPDEHAERAVGRLLGLSARTSLVAIAGPPGAGKSTVAERIRSRLASEGRRAAVVPMDGFHLDNAVLAERGLLHRKGAPETFDVHGFRHLVSRIAAGEQDVVYPLFDRKRDVAVAGAAVLARDTEFVLFEGNYLLLREAPWAALAGYWTFSIWMNAKEAALESRLLERWVSQGLPEAEALARLRGNDLPNVRFVCDHSAPGDLALGMEVGAEETRTARSTKTARRTPP